MAVSVVIITALDRYSVLSENTNSVYLTLLYGRRISILNRHKDKCHFLLQL